MECQEKFFRFDSTMYRSQIEHSFIQSGFSPSYVLQIAVLLPFHLPMPDDGYLTSHLNDFPDYRFIFLFSTRINQISLFPESYTPFNFGSALGGQTRVEMLAFCSSKDFKESENNSDFVSSSFDKMLNALNTLILAYSVVANDASVYRLRETDFNPVLKFRLSFLPSFECVEEHSIQVHTTEPTVKKILSPVDIKRITGITERVFSNDNPFIYSEELFLLARRDFFKGSLRSVLSHLQTGVETVVLNLYKQMCLEKCDLNTLKWLEGKNYTEPSKKPQKPSFKDYSKKWLKEKMDLDPCVVLGTKEYNDWYSSTSKIRNRSIHDGYCPTTDEAYLALNSSFTFRRCLVELMSIKKSEYPKTYSAVSFLL